MYVWSSLMFVAKHKRLNCFFCKMTSVIYKWYGLETPKTRPWKRYALLYTAIFMVVGIVALTMNLHSIQSNQLTPTYFILFGFVLLISILGLMIATIGCDSCVVRVFGNFDFTI